MNKPVICSTHSELHFLFDEWLINTQSPAFSYSEDIRTSWDPNQSSHQQIVHHTHRFVPFMLQQSQISITLFSAATHPYRLLYHG